MNADYDLISQWRVRGKLADAASILSEPRDLVHWWPEVYLAIDVLDEGDEAGIGQVARVHARGWLPYTLRWSFRVVESRWPHGATIEAWGDLLGRGTWSLVQNGSDVNATYKWRVRADKPLFRSLSSLLKPLFVWNHSLSGPGLQLSLPIEPASTRRDPAPALALRTGSAQGHSWACRISRTSV